jgi:hypothetical protein
MTARSVTTTAETYTLDTSTPDTVTVNYGAPVKSVAVINLADAGGTRMWVDGCRTPLGGRAERTLGSPTIGASGYHPVEAGGGWWALDFGEDGYHGVVTLMVVGGGNQYTIEVEPA